MALNTAYILMTHKYVTSTQISSLKDSHISVTVSLITFPWYPISIPNVTGLKWITVLLPIPNYFPHSLLINRWQFSFSTCSSQTLWSHLIEGALLKSISQSCQFCLQHTHIESLIKIRSLLKTFTSLLKPSCLPASSDHHFLTKLQYHLSLLVSPFAFAFIPFNLFTTQQLEWAL